MGIKSECIMPSQLSAIPRSSTGVSSAWFTVNAAKSAFYRFDARLAMIENVIKPGFAALGAS